MEQEFQIKLATQRLFQKNGKLPIIDQIDGTELENRWKITKLLGEGSFGTIYSGFDMVQKTQGVNRPIIVKFTQNHKMNDEEFASINDIIQECKKQNGENLFYAETHSKGQVIINDKQFYKNDKKESKKSDSDIQNRVWSYLIQDKLGDTMEDYIYKRNEPFTEKTVLQIGIQLLDSFKIIHEAGYIYKDLKLDNVLIGDDKDLPNSKNSLYKCRLIDFGLTKKYLQEDGTHIPKTKETWFKGNFIFASVNAFNLITQSRRDDLISLCYFMIYLVDGSLAFLQNEDSNQNEDDPAWYQNEFRRIQHLKNKLTARKICKTPEAIRLLPFVQEIFSLKFDEKPNYSKLRFFLVKILLDINQVPSTEYDWNMGIPQKDQTMNQVAQQQQPSSLIRAVPESVECNINNTEEDESHELIIPSNNLQAPIQLEQSSVHQKMNQMQGYIFKQNKNQEAMQKNLKQLNVNQMLQNMSLKPLSAVSGEPLDRFSSIKEEEKVMSITNNEILKSQKPYFLADNLSTFKQAENFSQQQVQNQINAQKLQQIQFYKEQIKLQEIQLSLHLGQQDHILLNINHLNKLIQQNQPFDQPIIPNEKPQIISQEEQIIPKKQNIQQIIAGQQGQISEEINENEF